MYLARLILSSIILLFAVTASAFEAGESVRLQGKIDSDTYAAGGTIFSSADVNGDLFASGGTIIVDGSVASDVLIIGGDITISATIGDDLRITAGSAVLNSSVSGDLLFAGGQLSLSPKNVVQGHSWLAGGQLDLGGQFHKGLNAIAGTIILSGHIRGDVELEAESIRIGSDTRIDGRLLYRSPVEATIHPDAKIQGGIHYEPSELKHTGNGSGIFALFSLMVSALVFYLLFSTYSSRSTELLRNEYWKGLGFGLVVFLLLPFIAFFSMGIVIGLWLGLMLLAVYAIALLVGSFLGMICSAEFIARLVHFDISTTARRLLSILVAYVLLGLLQYIPVVGELACFIILLSGLGAGTIVLYRQYLVTAE
ncbi:MAG: hypothetical protein OEX12_11695 [Gammaproteobacteria bacterium]|nr:hypothetical protein [Gammaproteobacteria bacterium]